MKNQALIHFNLSNTGLNQEIMYELMAYVRVSPSLVSLHLSSNPGVTEDAKAKYKMLLNAKYEKNVDNVILKFQEVAGDKVLHQDLLDENFVYHTLSTHNREQVQARRI